MSAQHTPGRPNPMSVTVKGREYSVYFHHETGEPHCVETTVRMQGVPAGGRRLSMHGPTARAAIAKASGSEGATNPYPSGSMREGWQRGYEGRPMLAAEGSDYARAYAEGQRAKATGSTT